jgi:small subunit ribosomal protein S6
MREYELIYIVHPDLDENGFQETMKRVSGWITEPGGEIVKAEVWGKRRLAYPLRKKTEGQFVLLHIKMAPTSGVELERNMRFLEPVMRFSLVAK